jgi:predicted N-formylglutamate amidohydrolase
MKKLVRLEFSINDRQAALMADTDFEPVELIEGERTCGLLLIADHAMRHLPARYGTLGLDPSEFERHIAYDIGVDLLVRALAGRLVCPSVMARFSRLLIDPNRGEDDPTLVRQLYDGSVISGNYPLAPDELEYRLNRFYRPFRRTVRDALNGMWQAAGEPPLVISIHSFTPFMSGKARPWHAGILWDADPRAARPLIKMLEAEPGLVVGDNEPYDGALHGDTLHEICTSQGICNLLIEVRQDLISSPVGIAEWANRLEPMLERLNELPEVHEIRHFGSRTKA